MTKNKPMLSHKKTRPGAIEKISTIYDINQPRAHGLQPFSEVLRRKRFGDLLGYRNRGPKTKRHASQLGHLREAERLQGHQGCVNGLTWHPGGEVLASVSDDRRAMLWRYPQRWWDPSFSPSSLPPGSSETSDSDDDDSIEEYFGPQSGADPLESSSAARRLYESTLNLLALNFIGQWDLNPGRVGDDGSPMSQSQARPSILPVPESSFEEWDTMPDCYLLQTDHTRNIFTLGFLPANPMTQVFSCNDTVVTGGIDEEVHRYSLHTSQRLDLFQCHSGTIQNVVTLNDSPYVWLTASEDGTVRQFDRRQQHRCGSQGGCANCILNENPKVSAHTMFPTKRPHNARDLRYLHRLLFTLKSRQGSFLPPNEFFAATSTSDYLLQSVQSCMNKSSNQSSYATPSSSPTSSASGNHSFERGPQTRLLSVAVNPVRSEYLLVGTSDPVLRVFDRRMLSLGRAQEVHERLGGFAQVPLQTFCPAHIQYDPFIRLERYVRSSAFLVDGLVCSEVYPTCVDWRADGKEFVANYSNESVYTFPFDNLLHEPNHSIEYKVPASPKKTKIVSASREARLMELCSRAKACFERENFDGAVQWYTAALEEAGPSMLELMQSVVTDLSSLELPDYAVVEEDRQLASILVDIWSSASGEGETGFESLLRLANPLLSVMAQGSTSSKLTELLTELRRYRAPILCNRAAALLRKPDVRRCGYSFRASEALLALFDALEAVFLAPDNPRPYDRLLAALLARGENWIAIRLMTYIIPRFVGRASSDMFNKHLQETKKLLNRQAAHYDTRSRGYRPPPNLPSEQWFSTLSLRASPDRGRAHDPSRHNTEEADRIQGLVELEDSALTLRCRYPSGRPRRSMSIGTAFSPPTSETGGSSKSRHTPPAPELDEIGGLAPSTEYQAGHTGTSPLPSTQADYNPHMRPYAIPVRERILHSSNDADSSPFDSNQLIRNGTPGALSHLIRPRVSVSCVTSDASSTSTDDQLSNVPVISLTAVDREPDDGSGDELSGPDSFEEEDDEEVVQLFRRLNGDLARQVDALQDMMEEDTSFGEGSSSPRAELSSLFPPVSEENDELMNKLIEATLKFFRQRKWRPQVSSRRFFGSLNCKTDLKGVTYWDSDGVIAASENGEILIWRHSDGTLLNVLHGHVHSVNAVKVHPQDAVFASAGLDHYIQLWRPQRR
eukprot:Blabericola_migrator_1__2017@NODE_154_length_12740_cov_225_658329_g135_i0_p1_GENE_NODE_154_length_12740_cov_225_658329_g135_i0NODE_154_length_12740_cov_225_658329_g135_i0_p1_ORF_typecomplete_len1180_score162_18WD40/PF00400_32/2e06WD40/PF00400_32/1_5e04WD40/PF00400_32/0_4WD40/PF00400_32/1_9e03WD40/PF00400_32/1_5e03WD40/PF00400_32/1_5e03WD40/PF00400_32/1_1e05ANAPC4_WD40/PF12894_7/0_013ANAPC4_WD40/PF12894_7/3_5ANAPC4_WD40/PF12894_7/1_3e02ANAPC4_WD40/PF12894_7/86ANAPC4_WD40/PF12894_7/7_7e05WD40_like